VAASLRLVRAFGRAGGKRLVCAGSCAEYDWSGKILDEASTPLAPATLYGEAKASLYRLLSAAAPGLDLSFAWGRIFFLFGPREKPGRLVSDLFDDLAKGKTAALSVGTQVRDFMHVEDVAAAFAALLDSEMEGPVNIASGQAVTVRELAEQAGRVAGGADRLSFGARPLQSGEPPMLVAAVERLRAELGFQPRFSLEEGLLDTYERRTPSQK
jgi:nucleoside-diphosphate-sugar epimerase